MPKIELKLFGSPSLFLDGIDVTPDRPVGFEILAKVIVAGVDGVSRASLSTLLWPDIPTTKARTNLRVNLANLRAELSQIGITDSFELDDAVLRTKGVIGVDLHWFLARPIRSVSELEVAILPLCKGWDRERWQEENEAVASHLAEGFCRIRQTSPKVDTLHLLRTAVKSHPVSTQLTTLYVDALTGQNRVDEATQAVIDFENAWISRFGVADLPNISLDAVAQPVAMESRPKAMTYAVPLCFLLVAVVALGYALNRPAGQEKSPKLAVADVRRESGYEIRKIRTEGAEPREISPLLGFSGQPMLHYRNQIFEVQQPGQISPIQDTQWIPVDTNGYSKLEVSPDASLLRISTASSQENIRPVADYPYFDAPMIVADGSVVYNRLCGHSFRDHRKLCYWKNGTENLIHISTPEPQNAVVTCQTARGIFGKYSVGKSDGWKYHTFYFDFQSQKTQMLDTPPVIAELGESLLVRPERTGVVNGDYRSHPLDYALLIDKSGRQRRISLASNDDVLGIFGGYIYVCRKKTQFTSELEFLNFDLEQVNPFPSLPKEVASFGVRTEEIAICVGFDHDRPTRELLLLSKS